MWEIYTGTLDELEYQPALSPNVVCVIQSQMQH